MSFQILPHLWLSHPIQSQKTLEPLSSKTSNILPIIFLYCYVWPSHSWFLKSSPFLPRYWNSNLWSKKSKHTIDFYSARIEFLFATSEVLGLFLFLTEDSESCFCSHCVLLIFSFFIAPMRPLFSTKLNSCLVKLPSKENSKFSPYLLWEVSSCCLLKASGSLEVLESALQVMTVWNRGF